LNGRFAECTEISGRKLRWLILKYSPSVCLSELGKLRNIREESRTREKEY
jgi:hypothetical protein